MDGKWARRAKVQTSFGVVGAATSYCAKTGRYELDSPTGQITTTAANLSRLPARYQVYTAQVVSVSRGPPYGPAGLGRSSIFDPVRQLVRSLAERECWVLLGGSKHSIHQSMQAIREVVLISCSHYSVCLHMCALTFGRWDTRKHNTRVGRSPPHSQAGGRLFSPLAGTSPSPLAIGRAYIHPFRRKGGLLESVFFLR